MLFGKFHHQGEHGWLGAAEVIGATAIRHVPVGIDQIGEVVDHVAQQLRATTGGQAKHREVRIPVIEFAKTAARHDIGMWQLQQRSLLRVGDRLPRENAP